MFCKITGKHERAQGPTQTHLTYVQRAKRAISALLSKKKTKPTYKINYQFCLFEPLDLTDVAYRLPHITCLYGSPKSMYFSHEKTKLLIAVSVVIKTTRTLSAFIVHFALCILHWLAECSGLYTLKLPFLENFQVAIKWEAVAVFTSKFSDIDTCNTFPLYYYSKQEEHVLLAG